MDGRRLLRAAANVFDPKFAANKRHFFLQSGLATLTLTFVLIFEDALANVAVLTAIASTTFLVFVSPSAVMAQPRRIVGGHLVGTLVALVVSYVLYDSRLREDLDNAAARDIGAALAVGLAMISMALVDAEHAPAAGTVLGLVLEPWQLEAAGAVMAAALILAGIRVVLRHRLIDLV